MHNNSRINYCDLACNRCRICKKDTRDNNDCWNFCDACNKCNLKADRSRIYDEPYEYRPWFLSPFNHSYSFVSFSKNTCNDLCGVRMCNDYRSVKNSNKYCVDKNGFKIPPVNPKFTNCIPCWK